MTFLKRNWIDLAVAVLSVFAFLSIKPVMHWFVGRVWDYPGQWWPVLVFIAWFWVAGMLFFRLAFVLAWRWTFGKE